MADAARVTASAGHHAVLVGGAATAIYCCGEHFDTALKGADRPAIEVVAVANGAGSLDKRDDHGIELVVARRLASQPIPAKIVRLIGMLVWLVVDHAVRFLG
jgi:hypothetical protein